MLVDQFGSLIEAFEAVAPVRKAPVSERPDFGQTIEEHKFKSGLVRLNSGIHFDMGANLNLWHPQMHIWQGVFHSGRHLCSMDRGVIPEYNVYELTRMGERGRVLRIGWRTTLEMISREHLLRLNWDNFRLVFGVERKNYMAHPQTLRSEAQCR